MSKAKIFIALSVYIFIFLSCSKEDVPEIIISDSYWQTDNPENHGFDLEKLQQGIDNASKAPNFYGLLVIRNNKLLVEEYFNGKNSNDLFHLRSITKNFTSALTGIAIEENLIESLDSEIGTYFPNTLEGKKSEITIRHLLNMASGLEWDENNEIIDLIEYRIPNPVETVMARNLASDPGITFNYNSVSPHIVSEIINSTQNETFLDYAKNKLLEPLGITEFEWEQDNNGNSWGGFGLQISGRDLAKFGQLYLNNGMWESQQLVPHQWIQLSQTSQIDIPNSTTDYSLQWWVADNLSDKVFFGQGFGGQALMIIPDKDLIIIGLQEYFVNFDQSDIQLSNFLGDIFTPIYQSVQ